MKNLSEIFICLELLKLEWNWNYYHKWFSHSIVPTIFEKEVNTKGFKI